MMFAFRWQQSPEQALLSREIETKSKKKQFQKGGGKKVGQQSLLLCYLYNSSCSATTANNIVLSIMVLARFEQHWNVVIVEA